MYRVFFTHKKLGRYCIRTYQDTSLQAVISEVSAELSKPKNHLTSCEILDDNDTIAWTYQPIRKSTKKEKKMREKQFSQYLVELLIDGGIDCCNVCDNNHYIDGCKVFDKNDKTVCYRGIREYVRKRIMEKEIENNG